MNRTLNLSFDTKLLAQIDKLAHQELRSRSELLREAARMYIAQKMRWDKLFAYGKSLSKQQKIKPSDIEKEIQAYRKSKRKAS